MKVQTPWEEHRVLVWGKTYPELSTKYYETVCTGGTREDGKFVRLYPIPFRYLQDQQTFSKYQWMKLRIRKDQQDPRPESYKVDTESICTEGTIAPDEYGWRGRSEIVFRTKEYSFQSVEHLLEQNRSQKTSMGFIYPKSIDRIEVEERPEEDYQTFMKRLEDNKQRLKQARLFDDLNIHDVKRLEYVSKRFKIHFHCGGSECNGHKMSIIDWEAYELVRKVGIDSTRSKLESILNMDKYHVGFFLGNFKLHPTSFAIGGIWWPKKTKYTTTATLF